MCTIFHWKPPVFLFRRFSVSVDDCFLERCARSGRDGVENVRVQCFAVLVECFLRHEDIQPLFGFCQPNAVYLEHPVKGDGRVGFDLRARVGNVAMVTSMLEKSIWLIPPIAALSFHFSGFAHTLHPADNPARHDLRCASSPTYRETVFPVPCSDPVPSDLAAHPMDFQIAADMKDLCGKDHCRCTEIPNSKLRLLQSHLLCQSARRGFGHTDFSDMSASSVQLSPKAVSKARMWSARFGKQCCHAEIQRHRLPPRFGTADLPETDLQLGKLRCDLHQLRRLFSGIS